MVRLCWQAICIWLATVSVVWAANVAVLPVEDLSLGQNGVNFSLTTFLREELAGKGVSLVPDEELIPFMVRNRIRQLGFLTTSNIIKVRDDLKADFVLLGTVCQYRETPDPTVGVALFLVRSGDAKVVWSVSGGGSSKDEQRFLGLTNPDSVDDMLRSVTRQLLEKWPEVLQPEIDDYPSFLVEAVRVEPTYVQPFEKVRFTLRLRPMRLDGDLPQVYLLVRDGQAVVLDQEENNLFSGQWLAPQESGEYPLDLILHWPSGLDKRTRLGYYHVDGESPELALELKGLQVEGSVVFRNQLDIVPRLLNREPLSRWLITVENLEDEIMASEEGKGELPPKLTWRGVRDDNQRVDEGDYLIRIEAWDRAGNSVMASEPVTVMRTKPEIEIFFAEQGDWLLIDLDYIGSVPLDSWGLELRSFEGELIHIAEGESESAHIEVPMTRIKELEESERIGCTVVLRDRLGNQIRHEVDDVLFAARQSAGVEEEEPEEAEGGGWVIEF